MRKKLWRKVSAWILIAAICFTGIPPASAAEVMPEETPAVSDSVEPPESAPAEDPKPEDPEQGTQPEEVPPSVPEQDTEEDSPQPDGTGTEMMLLTPQMSGVQTFAVAEGTVEWENFAVRQSPGATMPFKGSVDDDRDYTVEDPIFYWVGRPYVNGQLAFCVEPQMKVPSGTDVSQIDPAVLFSAREQQVIALISYYALEMGAATDDAVFGAAQMMIWEVCNGTLNYQDLTNNGHLPNIYYGGVVGRWEAQYEALRQAVLHYRTIPSFMTPYNYGAFLSACSYSIPSSYYDGGQFQGEMILEDYNSVVDQMNWPQSENFDFEVLDSSHLKITAKKDVVDWETFGPVSKAAAAAFSVTIVILGDGPGNLQDLGQFNVLSDPFGAYLRLRTEGDYEGECQIIKTDAEDGFVIGSDTQHSKGALIKLTFPDGHTEEVTLPYVVTDPGTYTVEELSVPIFDDPHLGYVISHEKLTFTVGDDNSWDDVIIQSGVNVPNMRQKGQIVIQKYDQDDNYINHWNIYKDAETDEGKEYRVENNTAVYWEGDFKGEILNPKPQGDASLEGAWFIVRAKDDVVLANGELAQHELYEYSIFGQIENGTANVSVQGLGVGPVKAGSIVAIGQTDEMGVFRTDADLDLGTYEVQEIVPSEGYQFSDYKSESHIITVDIKYTEQELTTNIHHVNYANAVLKGHISLIKVQDDFTGSEEDGVGANTPDGPSEGDIEFSEGTYWAIYLNSKKDSSLDEYGNYNPEIPVLDKDGNPANDGNKITVLPDEYYVSKPLDPDEPLALPTGELDANGYPLYCFVDENGKITEKSVNPDHDELIDTNPFNAYNKQLYMVLRTNKMGQASTCMSRTIFWAALGGSLKDVSEDFTGAMPLPYGTYTVVEINPNEGYEAVYGTVRIGYESWIDNSDGGYQGTLRRPELGINEAGEIVQNGLWGVDHDLYGRNSEDDGSLTRPITDKVAKMRVQVVKVDAESNPQFTEEEAVKNYEAALENWQTIVNMLKAHGKWEEAVANGTAPLQPQLEDFVEKGTITADKLSGMKIYTSEQLEELGYQPSSHVGFLVWAWNNVDNNIEIHSIDVMPSGSKNHDNDNIGDPDYGYWVVQDVGGTYMGTPSNPWMTDDDACIEFAYPLTYGDYTLVEVSAAYGYWLGDAINPTVQGIINMLACGNDYNSEAAEEVTQQMVEQYKRRYEEYQKELAEWTQKMDEWYQQAMVMCAEEESRKYEVIMASRPEMPQAPIRLSHDTYEGGNLDVEMIMSSDAYKENPELFAWLDQFEAKNNIVDFTISRADLVYPVISDTVVSEDNDAGYPSTYYAYSKILVIFAPNIRQKGYLELHKSGMQLTGSKSSVFDWNGKEYTLRQPVWDVLGLADASYGIYAAEDIVTPDGTVQYHAGDKVAQLTTNENGVAVSQPLDLGEYYCVEEKAPYGYILDETHYPFTLEYQGQNIRIYPERQWYLNIRQNIRVEIEKLLEKAGSGLGATDGASYADGGSRFETPEMGQSSAEKAGDVLYGLFAREDIYDRTGEKAIGAGQLIECIEISEGLGTSTLELPLGKYYLKELDNKDPSYLISETEYDFSFLYTSDNQQWVNMCSHKHDQSCGGLQGEEYCTHQCSESCMVQMTAEELYQNNLAGTGKGETVIHITANGGVAVLNLLKRGYVELYKFDEEYSLGLPDGLVTGELQGEPEIIESEDGTIIKSTYLDGDTLIQVEDHVIPESSGTRHLCTVTKGNDEPVTYQYLSLEGAVFGAYDENGQLCATATTDQNGYLLLGKNESAVRDGLPYGRWTIREISSPDGYRITDPDAEWIVEITEDGMIANRDISGALLYIGNRPDLPAVRVKKTDEGGNLLNGAQFTIFRLANEEEYKNYLDKKALYEQEIAAGLPSEAPAPVEMDWQVYRGINGDEWFVYETTDGIFESGSLEDGYYRIVETKNPDGFSGSFDQQFEVRAQEMTAPRVIEFSVMNHRIPDTPETPHKPFPDTGI